jgi:hypothetical protein
MMDLLQRLIAWLMNRVRVNHVQQAMRDGAPAVVKRRVVGSGVVIWFGNRFLSLAGSDSRMFVRASQWLDWERHCARLLYPDRSGPAVVSNRCVLLARAPGKSLRRMLERHEADVHALVAAARELRRVHQIHCSHYEATWSHGDLHLDNIFYDADSGQATLIDFDTRHELRVGVARRQGEDLMVFLVELIASADEQWCQLAAAFVEEYREASVLRELHEKLVIPCGLARILLYTRTNCLPMRRFEPRLHALQEIVHRARAGAGTDQNPAIANEREEPIGRGTVGNRA